MKRLQWNSPELYDVWKGQLYIQEHLACNVKFKSASTCSIPAQLPSKLEIKEVIQLSQLKKALPVQFFEKIYFSDQEVCFESVYYKLHAVITSNVNGFEFGKLQAWMKDHELALIKVLNDQGFLILLTSSALQCCQDLIVKDSFQLFALFVFPHTKLLGNTGTDLSYKFKFKEDISLKITELLPGLQYAILEARQMQTGNNLYPDALVEQHFRQFASLQRKNASVGELNVQPSDTLNLLFGHGKDIPDKCDQLAFSRLHSYFSSPVNFSVPLVKMSSLLKEDIPVSSDSEKCDIITVVKDSATLESKIPLLPVKGIISESTGGNSVLNENKKQPAKKRTFRKGGRRGGRKGRRKHTPQTALSSSAVSENQISNKKIKLIGGEQQQGVSSNRTTVKLASAPYTHRRKRGAEVLTAEFVNDDKVSETETSVTNKRNEEQSSVFKPKISTGKTRKASSTEDTYFVRERPPKRKASEPGNRNKLPEAKAKSDILKRSPTKRQEQSGKQSKKTMETINAVPFEQVGAFSKSSTDLSLTTKQSSHPASVPENDIMEKRISMYESHALNLLADLALNSLSSSSISYLNSDSIAPTSEPVDQEASSKSDSGNAEEYPQNSNPLSQSSASPEEPVQTSDCVKSQPKVGSDASATQHRTEGSEKQTSHKMLIAAAKAKARSNATSKISLEHSYSQLPKDDLPDKSSKDISEKPFQSVPEPTVTNHDNYVVEDQSSDLFFPRKFLLGTGDNVCPTLNTEPQEASKFQDNFAITFKWEAKYNFDLDSKFTSDPLEKTINRALHGPWNPDLKEKVEDVKIILHMWLALFYSKPSKQLTSSSRKVVEHSNPAKYVSINTVHDPLYEIAETDAADTMNGDESGPLRNSTDTQPHTMSEVSPVRQEMNSNQPIDLTVASKIQTKVNPRENEHRYSKYISSAEEMLRSSSSEKGSRILHKDLSSTVCRNDMSSENDDSSVSLGPKSHSQAETSSLHDGRLHRIADEDENRATSRVIPLPNTCVTRSTFDDAEVSPSDALNRNRTADVFLEADGHSDLSDATGEEFLKKRNLSVSWMYSMQNTHGNSVQHETISESADSRDLLEARLQDLNRDSALRQNKVQDKSKMDAITTNSNSEIGIYKEDPYYNNDLKSACFEEDQTHVKFSKTKDLSPLTSLKSGSSTAPLEDGKAIESGIQLSDDILPTVESTKAGKNSLELVNNEKSSVQGESQSQVTSNMDLLAESIKYVDSCTGIGLNNCKDANVDLKPSANNIIETETTSSTNDEILGESEQSSDEQDKCQKESTVLAKNCTHELPEKWSISSGYNQENEHSYVNKNAAFVNMDKLELSPSSYETSDVEELDTYDVGKSFTRSTEKSDDKSYSAEKLHVVDTVAEAPVPILHQDDARSSEDLGCQVNGNEVVLKITEQSTKMDGIEKTEESQSPFPPRDGERVDGLQAMCADFQAKATEAVDCKVLQSDVENNSETDIREDPPDNTAATHDQEVRLLSSAEISEENTESCFGEKTLLLGSKSSKVVDLESLGDESLLLGLETSETVDLESLAKKSSLLDSESSKCAGLESLEDKSSNVCSETDKDSDLECVSVFEKLNLKAVEEIYTTQSSICAKKQELQNQDTESPSAEKETKLMQTDLCSDHVLDTEDQLVTNKIETENGEIRQSLSSEMLNEVTSAFTLVGKSCSNETTQDSDSAKLVNKCVDGNDLLPAESQSDSTSDAGSVRLSPDQPEKNMKNQTQSMRNKIRKEILSKLKRICQGSGISQHISSNSEDEVYIVHEKPGKCHTGEQKEQTDIKKVDLSRHEKNSVSLAESTSITEELQISKSKILEEGILQEKAENNQSIPSADPVDLQKSKELASQDESISPLHDVFSDNMDQDFGPDQSEICCILNTGSISKEQYDRWPETSDEDIEFIQAYKEPPTHKTSKHFLKECPGFPNSPPEEEPKSCPEPSHSRKAKHKRHSDPNTSLQEAGEHVPRYNRDSDYPSHGSQRSFIITKKLKDVRRTCPTIHKESSYACRSDHDSLLPSRRKVSSDLTQNTLDMEHLRFMCRLKDVLRKSSTDVHVSEPPYQAMFDSRKIPGCSSSRTKCLSPLLITVRCAQRKRDYRGHDSWFPSTSYSQGFYDDELRDKPAYYSRTSKKVRAPRASSRPYHFNRLRYEDTLERPNSDISMIIKECTQSSQLKLSRVGLGSTSVERTSACPVPEESGWQIRQTFDPSTTKSQLVGNIISDLCTNLHTRLHSVARESAQKNCYFYLCKTSDEQDDDDDFFSLTKSFLIKDGYTPIKPQDFCDSQQSESDKLLVIIRNESVSSQIHKIPCLLKLRLRSNVTFAGVDTPEDLSESMYHELLQTGGFVVSDKALLESITIEKLKEVLRILEKMNRTSAWKWLIHYGEYRKLKEDKRAESVSRSKVNLLKSYQQWNAIEILPYHQCDSRSKDTSSDLECLLSLQSQHIRSRLAVYVTATPSTEAEEFEQNGILVYDVDTFIRRIQKVDSQLQPSFWS